VFFTKKYHTAKMQMYVPHSCRSTKEELEEYLDDLNNSNHEYNLTPLVAIEIHYVYNHNKPNFDGGLSLIDSIYNKLSFRHPEWNIDDLKSFVLNSDEPMTSYVEVIEEMLEDPEDADYYGW